MRRIGVDTPTPWGTAQTVDRLADGIVSVTTAGHGGVHLSPARLREMRESERTRDGWYEEDCEAAFVFAHFTANGTIPVTQAQKVAYAKWRARWGEFAAVRMPGH